VSTVSAAVTSTTYLPASTPVVFSVAVHSPSIPHWSTVSKTTMSPSGVSRSTAIALSSGWRFVVPLTTVAFPAGTVAFGLTCSVLVSFPPAETAVTETLAGAYWI
jgi:hypothetical protein